MSDNLRDALTSMGYRELKDGIWAKPVGFQLLACDEKKGRLYNYFRTMQGEVDVYQGEQLIADERLSYLMQIKMFEYATRLDMYVDGKSEFHLSPLV